MNDRISSPEANLGARGDFHPVAHSRVLYRNRSDVERLLRDYFRYEMPYPWPAAPVAVKNTLPQGDRSQSWWRRSRSRLALAAAAALFFVGYGVISWAFPNLTLTGSQRIQSPFAKTIKIDETETENGVPVRVRVISDGKKISIGVQPLKKPAPRP